LKIGSTLVEGENKTVLFSKIKNDNILSNIKREFDPLNQADKSKFLDDFKDATPFEIKMLNDKELLGSWKKLADNPRLEPSVQLIARRNTTYIELYKRTINSVKLNGERLDDHIFIGHLDYNNPNTMARVTGIKGVHHELAITESNPITLQITGYTQNGKPIYGGPPPTSTVPHPVAIEAGTINPASHSSTEVYEAQVYVWGQAVDNTGANVPAWMPKSNNGGKTSIFPSSWDKEKTMQEITYARWKLTPSDYAGGNQWNGVSSNGSVNIGMYLGANLSSPPTTIPAIIENYGSAFPIR
jgi:hypothetical protein